MVPKTLYYQTILFLRILLLKKVHPDEASLRKLYNFLIDSSNNKWYKNVGCFYRFYTYSLKRQRIMFRARHFKDVDEILEYIQLIGYIAEAKEWDNRAHLERMRGYTRVLCSGLNIPKNDVEIISIASMLHDIGKILIPEKLLQHNGDYTKDEWHFLEKHTNDCSRLLGNPDSLILQTGLIIARTHHERWDGSGYPKKLRREEIPLSGRVCAIADVFDALVTERPYKKVIPESEAIDIIVHSSGSLFDPACIKAFEKSIDEILVIKTTSNANRF